MRIITVFFIFFLLTSVTPAKTLQDGLALYKSGNYPGAEAVFRDITSKNPSDDSARYMLAATLVHMQRYNEAKELYKSVIATSSNESIVNLCRTGLSNLGESSDSYTSYSPPARTVTKATLNVNIAGGVLIVNDVVLNRQLKSNFILDTGATYTMISNKTAARLGISTRGVETIKIMTGSGYINAPLITIPEIELKGLVVRDVEAIVADLPVHSSNDNHDIVGLLGLSYLNNFIVSIDRANNKVVLEKN